MLMLNSRNVTLSGLPANRRSVVLRLRRGGRDPIELGDNEVLLVEAGTAIGPGQAALARERDAAAAAGGTSKIIVPNEMDYLDDGDVLAVELQRPAVRVLYRRNSQHNSFLLTERCNHYCLMCSQPPKDVDDDWIVDELFQAIPLVSPETRSLGFTGGEPTLLGDRFLRLVRDMRDHLPATSLHILSNGRRFVDPQFARAYAAIERCDARHTHLLRIVADPRLHRAGRRCVRRDRPGHSQP
jgi:hypothetical protein